MATYCIGDVHACYHELLSLLDKISFSPGRDLLYFTGDLIGRGPYPLETLRLVMRCAEQGAAFTVIGNHELGFFSVYEGLFPDRPKNGFGPLLEAPDRGRLCDFLRSSPFMLENPRLNFVLTHAGVYPGWDLDAARERARELERVFADPPRLRRLLRNMYDDSLIRDEAGQSDLNRLKFALNVFTRMRYCREDLSLDYGHSSQTPSEVRAAGLRPWFERLKPLTLDGRRCTLFFGHWAALQGRCAAEHVRALDTGCLWGGALTCYCVDSAEFVSVPSEGHLEIG